MLSSRINSKTIVISLSVLLLLYFVIFPMGILLFDSVVKDGAINLENYRNVYSADVNWKALTNTVELSLMVMIASVIITFPLAWLVGRTDMPGKKGFRTLLVSSYMIPPYVGAIAWVQLLNPSVGYLNNIFKFIFGLETAPFDIYTFWGLAWVLTLFYSPFAFITISRAMEKMDPTLEEAARVSGASPLRTVLDVTFVGMPGNIEVMTTRIVTYIYMGDDAGVRDSTALAASLMFIANFLLMGMTWMMGRKDYTTISGKSTRPNIVELGKWKWPAFFAVGLYGSIAVIIPLGSIVLTSFLKSMSKPIEWSNIGIEPWIPVITSAQYMESVWNSVVYGVIAATIGTLVSLFVAYLAVKTKIKGRSIPDLLVVIGGSTPSIVIALALIITFSGNFGLNMYSTMWIIIVSYLVKYMTMSVRTIAAALSQVHISLEEAALNSGANWLRCCKDIIIPLIAPSVIAGWFLIFMPSFYELTMSLLLYGSDTKTIGVLLYELQTYADTQNASVLSVIILMIVLIGNLILNKLSKGNVGI